MKKFIWLASLKVQKVAGPILGLLTVFILPRAYAADIPQSPTISITSVSGVICYIYYGFDLMFWILIALSTVMVLVGAYNYLTAQGESEKVSKATKTLTWAAVGIAVALIAYNVPEIVGSFFHAGNLESNCY